jgi:hypothetical protein
MPPWAHTQSYTEIRILMMAFQQVAPHDAEP